MNHKKFALLALCCVASLYADSSVTPTIVARSQGRDATRKLVGVSDKIHLYDAGRYFNFSVMPEYTKTFRASHIAESLFGDDLTNCKSILIQGSEVAGRDANAWLADYFYLPPDYNASFSIEPRIQNVLVDLDFYVGLDEWMDGMYFRLHGPITWTHWNLNFCESCDVLASGSYSAGYFDHAGMGNALLLNTFGEYAQGKTPFNTSGTSNQTGIGTAFHGLKYAKMEQCARDRTGFADLRAELGYNFIQKEKYRLGANFQVAAPTGNKRNARFAFDPTIGNGDHWEIGGGITGQYFAWRSKDEDKYLGISLDANLTHMVAAREQRTFDLKGKSNSRYMLAEKLGRPVIYLGAGTTVTASAVTQPIAQFQGVFAPVANLTTVNVNVHSSIQADIVAMLNYSTPRWEFDLGYNFWARSCEKISLPARPTNDCCSNLCTGDKDVWALKGDAHVFGFMSVAISPLSQNTPIALSATQCGATIHKGTNADASVADCTGVDRLQNCGVNNAQFGYVSTVSPLVHTPGLTAASDRIKTSLEPVFINCCDINFQCTKGISHKLFTHASYTWPKDDWTPYLGAGASVEFGIHSCSECCTESATACGTSSSSVCSGDCVDSATSQWAIWLKGGMTFH